MQTFFLVYNKKKLKNFSIYRSMNKLVHERGNIKDIIIVILLMNVHRKFNRAMVKGNSIPIRNKGSTYYKEY
jgi:hypothetical protein